MALLDWLCTHLNGATPISRLITSAYVTKQPLPNFDSNSASGQNYHRRKSRPVYVEFIAETVKSLRQSRLQDCVIYSAIYCRRLLLVSVTARAANDCKTFPSAVDIVQLNRQGLEVLTCSRPSKRFDELTLGFAWGMHSLKRRDNWEGNHSVLG
jgi:hypothetical protein